MSGPLAHRHYFVVPLATGLRSEARRRVEALIDEMFRAIPSPALLVYLKACRLQDHDGLFDMSAATARRVYGSRKQGDGGDEYLGLLLRAGLIAKVASGYRGIGTEYRVAGYVPQDAEDLIDRAIQAFRAFKLARRARTAASRVQEGREA